MANETNKEQLPPPKEEKIGNYYYFQFRDNFFQQYELKEIKTAAELNGDNPNDYQMFWIKLIAASLKTRGYIRKPDYDVLDEGFFKSILDFETSGTAKETIALVSRIIMALEEKKFIFFMKERRVIKIPIVERMTMNKKEESERIRMWRLERLSLEDKFNSMIDKSKLDPETEFDVYFNKTFAGLIYYNYASERDREDYKTMLHLLYKENQNLDLATDDFINAAIPLLSISVIDDKINYMKAVLKDYLQKRNDMYIHMKMTRSKITTSKGTSELIEIASYDWTKRK